MKRFVLWRVGSSCNYSSELLIVDVSVRLNMIFPVDEIQEGTNILNKAKKKFTWP